MVKRTERGWAGHFVCAQRCIFRRNTLLEFEGRAIVVSTVGAMRDPLDESRFEEIHIGRHFETMAFEGQKYGLYIDADISKPVRFDSPWYVADLDDLVANDQHEAIVDELIGKLEAGTIEAGYLK